MAALHWLAVGDVDEAMATYQRAGALREAVTLGTARLLPNDPPLVSLRRLWAAQLLSQKQYSAAAAQYIAGARFSSSGRLEPKCSLSHVALANVVSCGRGPVS